MNKNYIQVRFESQKIEKSEGMILHNTRKIKPSYLKDCYYHNKFKNKTIIFDNNNFKEYESDFNDKENKTIINNLLKEQLKNELELCKKNKSFRVKKHAITQDSIITLSNSINEKLENKEITKQQLEKHFLDCIKKLEQIGLKPLNCSIHYDETTPHCHISFRNYYNNKSISNSLKKNYSKSQDLVGEVFNSLGYTRGVKKEITKKEHKTIQQGHQIEKELKEISKNNNINLEGIELIINNLKNQKIEKELTNLERFNQISNLITIQKNMEQRGL